MKPKSRLLRPRGTLSATEVARIAELEARVAAAEARLVRLESSPANWPKITPVNPYIPVRDAIACPKCGETYFGSGFSCGDTACPMVPRG